MATAAKIKTTATVEATTVVVKGTYNNLPRNIYFARNDVNLNRFRIFVVVYVAPFGVVYRKIQRSEVPHHGIGFKGFYFIFYNNRSVRFEIGKDKARRKIGVGQRNAVHFYAASHKICIVGLQSRK